MDLSYKMLLEVNYVLLQLIHKNLFPKLVMMNQVMFKRLFSTVYKFKADNALKTNFCYFVNKSV